MLKLTQYFVKYNFLKTSFQYCSKIWTVFKLASDLSELRARYFQFFEAVFRYLHLLRRYFGIQGKTFSQWRNVKEERYLQYLMLMNILSRCHWIMQLIGKSTNKTKQQTETCTTTIKRDFSLSN